LGSWTDELVTHVRGCQHIAIEAMLFVSIDVGRPYGRPI